MSTTRAWGESRQSVPRSHHLELQPWDRFFRAAILVALAALVYFTVRWRIFHPIAAAAGAHQWMRLVVNPSLLWAAMGTLMLVFRTLLWFRYRTPAAADFADAPPLTVVIPAYNEGPMIAKSIDSVVAARYPRDRLEIVVVDDGSRDDTWEHIAAAARRHPGVVTTVRFAKNRGKRAALEAGFRRARGDVLVTIDSDSVIDDDTLLAIAGPFSNPRIGAVAGRVTVLNHDDGVIPRMLKVRYALSFDYLRAVQSTYGTVYCCPGALTAYRAKVVHAVLDQWMDQRFLGVGCTYGEDRSMTNFVLAAGFDTVYQRAAIVRTVVPSTYVRLCKMLLRWDRSYVREELRFARSVVWKRSGLARAIALADVAISNLRFPVALASLVVLCAILAAHPLALMRVLFAIALMAAFNILYYVRSERSWDFMYGILFSYFSFFGLFWIFPFAVVTVRARGWLTR